MVKVTYGVLAADGEEITEPVLSEAKDPCPADSSQ